jgi:hypothetical protein
MKTSKVDVYPVKNGGALVARAHVTLLCDKTGCEVCIKGFRVHEKEDGTNWVGPPSENFVVKGKRVYKDMMWLNQVAQNMIYSAIIEKLKT